MLLIRLPYVHSVYASSLLLHNHLPVFLARLPVVVVFRWIASAITKKVSSVLHHLPSTLLFNLINGGPFGPHPSPPPARTVWYKAIFHKIPSRSLLHYRIPQDHPSPLCNICSNSSVEDVTHFLFSCPSKLLVWREMYQTYISPSVLSDAALLYSL